jgi:hypothetical protein
VQKKTLRIAGFFFEKKDTGSKEFFSIFKGLIYISGGLTFYRAYVFSAQI